MLTRSPRGLLRFMEKPLDNRSTSRYSAHMNIVAEPVDLREHILDVAQTIIGAKGYSAVGLTEILSAANVPKGSFYYYFKSKDAFGEALLHRYFEKYLAELDSTLGAAGFTMGQRLTNYFVNWQQTQESCDCQGKCLAVKLGAEVVDLSEAMRLSLKAGTSGIINRLQKAIEAGIEEGSIRTESNASITAHTLYQLWLGASLMAKINRSVEPFKSAMMMTKEILGLKT